MNNNELRHSQIVNKVYLKQTVEENDIVRFKNAMLKNVNTDNCEERAENLYDFIHKKMFEYDAPEDEVE